MKRDEWMPIDDTTLVETTRNLAALTNASHAEQLRWLAELHRRKVWADDGQTGLVAWLGYALGHRRRTAVEHARVVDHLPDLPLCHDAYAQGRLSWDQYVAASELADETSDAHWAENAPGLSAEDLQTRLREKRRRQQDQETSALRLSRRQTGPNIVGRLRPEAIDALTDQLDDIAREIVVADPETNKKPPRAQQRALALEHLAGLDIETPAAPRPATVVAHLQVDDLDNPDTLALLESGQLIDLESVRHLLCNGRIEIAFDTPDGHTLGIKRASRTWPARLARQIRYRDNNTCRFPGCDRPAHEIHHIAEWTAHAGPTNANNGISLCWHHHHLIHDHHWRITGNPDTTLTFTSPTGRKLEPSPPAPMTQKLQNLWNQTRPHRQPPPDPGPPQKPAA